MIQNSLPFRLLILKLAFIDPAFGTDKTALPIGIALIEVSYVVGAIRVEQLPFSMRDSIIPLPIIDQTLLVECTRL